MLESDPDIPKPLISSACPAAVRLICQRFPKLIPNISKVSAPFEIVAILEDPEAAATRKPADPPKEFKAFSLPVQPGLFDPLVDPPKVLRVVALSGGYKRPEACAELAKNRGIVASFSRALLEDLRAQMSDDEFNASLASAIDEIYQGSTKKVAVAA